MTLDLFLGVLWLSEELKICFLLISVGAICACVNAMNITQLCFSCCQNGPHISPERISYERLGRIWNKVFQSSNTSLFQQSRQPRLKAHFIFFWGDNNAEDAAGTERSSLVTDYTHWQSNWLLLMKNWWLADKRTTLLTSWLLLETDSCYTLLTT